ncbi:unnamed protein product [Prorocentrum cordatum]|uniref:Secreted protein n=1 Tax=Prorocentrum cordatum TaxID=2364126 RepID=A0ABN9SDH3_9DINO|nr:unnamed protein product [Polarella glacialis]
MCVCLLLPTDGHWLVDAAWPAAAWPCSERVGFRLPPARAGPPFCSRALRLHSRFVCPTSATSLEQSICPSADDNNGCPLSPNLKTTHDNLTAPPGASFPCVLRLL